MKHTNRSEKAALCCGSARTQSVELGRFVCSNTFTEQQHGFKHKGVPHRAICQLDDVPQAHAARLVVVAIEVQQGDGALLMKSSQLRER
jgi:hypothetical protein